MFGLFKKKTEAEKLNEKYQKLMSEAHKISSINRRLSDSKTAEANEILDKLNALSA